MTARELLLAPLAYMPPPKVLEGLTAEQAGHRLPGAPHTIVELVAHLGFWQTWFLERVAGRAAPMPATASLGWPDADAAAWDRLRREFLDGLDRAAALAETSTAKSQRVAPAIEFPPLAEYTIADAMTHVAVHNAHHLGQVVTLRQLLGAWPPPGGSWTW
jgi:uncharacterized damage-inducible protein DinB